MRCILQRTRSGAVTVNGERRAIGRGLVILIGIHHDDTAADADAMAAKCAALRIFNDADGKMNLSVRELDSQSGAPGQCLVVSQFTLYADARRGRRPSFTDAAPPSIASPLYERFVTALRGTGLTVKTGEFGADMLVEIENDGPVTILLDSEAK
jgi:D-tyrosyl-tRNA(Tyr) deacylase